MNRPIVSIRDLSKRYSYLNPKTRKREDLVALDKLTLDIYRGEHVAIFGKNGSGKSTFLKIISKVVSPSSGAVQLNANIVSLLELGTGFHGDLTGRENAFVYGGILGLKRLELKQKLDEIIEFAELDGFMDLKVRHYSSGMKVRLAFGIAIQTKADLIIADEILSVGDRAFREKCISALNTLKRSTALLIVDHNRETLSKLCNKAIWLEEGRLAMSGSVEEVNHCYMKSLNSQIDE